jgi:N-acetyl-anhydromuramyl-L-alanine amidase AmpD
MKKVTLFIAAAISSIQFVSAQQSHSEMVPNEYTAYFTEAYQKYPAVPVGILEAVSFNHTRFNQLTHPADEEQSCTGIPLAYGVMGLTLDGKNYFHNNLLLVADLSGISKEDIMNSAEKSILAYAAAYAAEKQKLNITSTNIEDQLPVLKALSELPDSTAGQQYALNSDMYVMFTFLNNATYQKFYNLPAYTIDIKKVFGEDTYNLLTSPTNSIEDINSGNTSGFIENSHKATGSGADYSGAIWNPAASCNYTVGRTMSITAIVIHDMEGSYAASISWFQNCSSVVSAHYCIRSSDGQITQMVHEADKAWHVGSENGYTIGIEHEGYAAKTGWYTDTMYATSSQLVRTHICPTYSILSTRVAFWPWAGSTYYNKSSIPGACTLIKGHQHYPNQTHTDPGPNWDWDYYYKKINDPAPTYTTYTAATGNFYDDGGVSGNYNNDENSLYLIAPTGAKTVTLSFSSYNTENTWDYMYIHDGNNIYAPLIGIYTGTAGPGTVTSTGPALCIEFRSDCATTETGWAATWTGNTITGIASNMGDNAVKIFPNPFSSSLNVTTDNGNVDIVLYDMLGREVINERNASSVNHSATINTQSLPNGVYFVRVTGTELSYTEKVVKN